MPLDALGLLLVAAILHAGWNVMLKRAKAKQVFMWWGTIVGGVCFSAILLTGPALPARIWPYILASSAMEAIYYITLTWAYSSGDFSLTYPLARGAAPALLALWATLFLSQPPRAGGLLGLAILIGGLIVVGSANIWTRKSRTSLSVKGIVAALITALCISLYSVVDGAAVKIVSPVQYIIMIYLLSSLFFAPMVFARFGGREVLREWRVNWKQIVLVGVAMLVTYLLVLQVYTMAPVSYAGAVREVSIVFGAIIGWRWLGEKFGKVRVLGAILIFIGILVIALAG